MSSDPGAAVIMPSRLSTKGCNGVYVDKQGNMPIVHQPESPFGDRLISSPITPQFHCSRNFIINIIQNIYRNKLSIALRDVKHSDVLPISMQIG